ncbi:glycosyl transferase, family 25 [Hyphomicrobium sp. 1Nfss2.1]
MSLERAESADGAATAKISKLVGSASIPTFFINRDCDEDRRGSVCAHLSGANMTAERIPGVEGLNVPGQFREFFFEGPALHSKLKPGEVGCYASHLVAMQRMLDQDLEYALILEDDAILPTDAAEIVRGVIASMPKGWDLVHLCKDSNRAVKIISALDGDRKLVRYSRVPETTTGYLVSRSGARKFLKPMKRYWPIDTDFRQPWRFGLDIYGVTPCFIKPEGFASAIHLMGNHSRLRRGLPLPSRYCWTGNPLHTPSGVLFNLRTLGPLTWGRCALRNGTRRIVKMLGLQPALERLSIKGANAMPGGATTP